MISWPALLLDNAERERNRLQSRLAVLSPLSILFPPQANLPNKVTAFRQVTTFLHQDRATPSEHRLYIGVTNNTGQTVRNVGVRVISANIPDRPLDWRLLTKDTNSAATDIPPRLTELFFLGEVMRRERTAFAGSHRVVDETASSEVLERAARHAKLHVGLIVHHAGGKHVLLRNDGQTLQLIAHGEDVEPAAAEMVLNMKDEITLEVRPVALSRD
jgi:hypothetical protein